MIGRRIAGGLGELRSAIGSTSGLGDPSDDLIDAFGARASSAGVSIDERIAVGVPAIMAPVSVIAEDVGKLGAGLHIYRRTGPRSRERVTDRQWAAVDRLLCVEPNPEQSAVAFWEAMTGFLKLWHRSYAYIERNRLGRIVGLWPMAPDRTRPCRDVATGELIGYRTEVGDRHEPVDLLPRDVLAFEAGLYAGDGKSPIMRHREAIGLVVASEEYAARYFANDASAGGLIEVPAEAPDGAADRMWAKWQARHSGLSRKFTVGMLEGGAKWKDVGAPPRDAQLVESQRWGVEQGCRIMRCPLHKVQSLERATFSNIEQQNIDYVVDSLGGPTTRFEVEMRRKLFPASRHGETGELFSEFLFDALLRGDIETRYRAYAIARQWGWMSADDVRSRENMGPLPDGQGEHYLQPLNMVPAGQLPERPAGPAARGSAAALEGDDAQIEQLGRLLRFLERAIEPPQLPPRVDVDSRAYPAEPMRELTAGGGAP